MPSFSYLPKFDLFPYHFTSQPISEVLNNTNLPLVGLRELFKNSMKDNIENYMDYLHQIRESQNPSILHKEFCQKYFNHNIANLTQHHEHIPECKIYQSGASDYDIVKIIEEINKISLYIPEGQILFHGGSLTHADISPNSTIQIEKLVSTSYLPFFAFRHSRKEIEAKNNGLWIIHVESKIQKAMLLPNYDNDEKGDSALYEEFELLLPPNFSLEIQTIIPDFILLPKASYNENYTLNNQPRFPISVFI